MNRVNEWQADVTHWQLATGAEVEILNMVDDHSRLNIAADARATTRADDVVATFRKACGRYGIPASMLTDIQARWRLVGRRIVRPAV